MRHRMGMAASTGLGNPDPALLPNNWPTNKRYNSLVRRCLDDAIKQYFTKDHGWLGVSAWCDFGVGDDCVMMGQEPAYFGENLIVICIHRDKGKSYIRRGHAFGYYGSGIRSKYRYYKDYKLSSKFVRFVDRWHNILFKD